MVPDYPEPLIGFRRFRLNAGKLQSFYQASFWHPGINQARCGQRHLAPHPNCQCGLYAYFNYEDAKFLQGLRNQIIGSTGSGKTSLLDTTAFQQLKPPTFTSPLGSSSFPKFPKAGVAKTAFGEESVVAAVKMWGRLEVYESGARSQYAQIMGFLKSKELRQTLNKLSCEYQVPIFSERAFIKMQMKNPPRP